MRFSRVERAVMRGISQTYVIAVMIVLASAIGAWAQSGAASSPPALPILRIEPGAHTSKVNDLAVSADGASL
ncbi:MAG: hypothetical protein MRY63_04870, partial [Neomegalonema sp.]|nr:hypothetical protein [Neomegalonema sp.]